MEEVLNPGVVVDNQLQTESASPQTEANQDQTLSDNQTKSAQDSHDQQDKGWIRKVRRDRDDAIRKQQEAERREQMKDELIKQLMSSQSASQPAKEDIFTEIQKAEYVEGTKVVQALKQQKDEFEQKFEELKKMQQQTLAHRQEEQIKSQYEDFDDIVNPDTLDMLKENNPKLFNRVANLLKADPMDGAVFAYEQIVASGIADQIPGLRRKKEVDKKLEQNKKTIQSPVAYDSRPIAQAMSFADKKKANEALHAETMRYASMAGFGY